MDVLNRKHEINLFVDNIKNMKETMKRRVEKGKKKKAQE